MKVRWPLITLFLLGLAMVAFPLYQATYPNIKALEPMTIMPMPTEQGTRVTDPTPTATPSPTPSLNPTPSPTATPRPVYTPLPTPMPCFVCSECSEPLDSATSGIIIKNTGFFVRYSCPTAKKFQNRTEVEAFMLWDKTDSQNVGVCIDYAEAVIKSAAQCGYQAGIGIIRFATHYHSFVVFPTVEDDDVYVDPTMGDWWLEATATGWQSWHMVTGAKWFVDRVAIDSWIER